MVGTAEVRLGILVKRNSAVIRPKKIEKRNKEGPNFGPWNPNTPLN